jgi:hypothetical protein
MGKGDWKGALADFDEHVRLDPKSAPGYANRALLRAACPEAEYRDAKKAMADAKKACELTGWTGAGAIEAYAAACAESGDFAAAQEWLAKVTDVEEHMRVRGATVRECLTLYAAKRPYRLVAPMVPPRKE